MNNYEALDYKNKDWTHDHDSLIPKHSQEFPRLSKKFNSRFDKNKPWGINGDPVYYEHSKDAMLEIVEQT
jgi:hypothetical protein